MKVLVIGGGGREHAIVHTLKKSPKVDYIWCAPGNGGIAAEAECVAIKATAVQTGKASFWPASCCFSGSERKRASCALTLSRFYPFFSFSDARSASLA